MWPCAWSAASFGVLAQHKALQVVSLQDQPRCPAELPSSGGSSSSKAATWLLDPTGRCTALLSWDYPWVTSLCHSVSNHAQLPCQPQKLHTTNLNCAHVNADQHRVGLQNPVWHPFYTHFGSNSTKMHHKKLMPQVRMASARFRLLSFCSFRVFLQIQLEENWL